jgi:hypothetical protein
VVEIGLHVVEEHGDGVPASVEVFVVEGLVDVADELGCVSSCFLERSSNVYMDYELFVVSILRNWDPEDRLP